MDYERKYNAVLQTAKQWIKDGCTDKEKICLECVFPELKESEDEIHRKWILEYLYDGLRKADEQFKDHFRSAIAWLEKQKESLHIPETCKENADSFTDEKDRNILGCIGMALADVSESRFKIYGVTLKECLAYLEKQKDASKAIEAVERIDKYIDEHLANAHDMKDSNPDKKYYRGWDDALGKMAGILQDVYSDKKQKEMYLSQAIEVLEHENYLILSDKLKSICLSWKPKWEINNPHTTKWTKEMIDEKFKELVEEYHKQKPVEWSEKHIADIFEKVELAKIVREQGNDALTNALQDAMLELSKVENAEWSEEDEKMRWNLINAFTDKNNSKVDEFMGLRASKAEILDFLKSLRPQPRKEIYQASKHDLAIKFMNYLDENRLEGKMSLSNGECEDIDKAFIDTDWGKILRYANKYSKKNDLDAEIKKYTEHLYNETFGNGQGTLDEFDWEDIATVIEETAHHFVNRQKECQPSWKPSEGQMKALRNFSTGLFVGDGDCDALRSLYEDLKKL